MRLLLLQILLILTTTVFAQTPRGRVQIKDGSLVTDKGTLLRGCFAAPNNSFFALETREQIAAIKNMGLNSIHVYADSYWEHELNGAVPGYLSDKVDSLVKWTRNDSLYLILTFAGGITENKKDTIIEFIKDSWRFYAERYKNETHLIFEIYNEPGDIPFDPWIIDMERELYQIIRSLAPETHILFFSPPAFYYYAEFLADIAKLGDGIDWSNASIAAHAYNWPAQDYIEPIKRIKNAGYALTITEFHSFENENANLALTRVFEKEHVSYMHFIAAKQIIANPAAFMSRVESSEVRWKPDFGTWPLSITKINYQSPYRYWPAIYYDEGAGWINYFVNEIITYISNNEYVAYYNIDFQDGPATFEAWCSATASDGRIELRIDSLDGPLVGICNLASTGSLDKYEPFSCDITTPFTGVHNIYLKFKRDANSPLFNLKSWYFGKSELVTPQTSYHGAASVLPGKIEAEEYDYGGSTISFLELDKVKNGLRFRNDDVDIDTTGDGGYCIGWTEPGEWLEYTVSCEQATAMDIQLRIACTAPGDKIKIKLNNKALAIANLPNTGGWQNWQTVTVENITIPAGEKQVLRIEILGGYFNLDWLNFVAKSVTVFDKVNSNERITFYPNPAKDYIKITTNENATVEILTIQGLLLKKKQVSPTDNIITINELTSGSYVVRIVSGTNVFSEILIIE
jgi:hypothetical protein